MTTKMTLAGTCLALAGLLQAGAVHARDKVYDLQPSSPWNVDWADNYCVLQRMFGEGDEGVLLRVMAFVPGANYQIQLTGELADLREPKRAISVAFAPFPEYEANAMGASVKNATTTYPSLVFSTQIARDAAQLAAMAHDANARASDDAPAKPFVRPLADEVHSLDVDLKLRELVFQTGSLAKPLAALTQCADNLLAKWGVDPELQRQVVTRPRMAGTSALVRKLKADFMSDLGKQGAQGRVNVVVTLDAKGTPLSCRVPISQNDQRLDEMVCERMMKLQFEPARRADGSGVASYFTTTTLFTQRRQG